MSIYLSSGMQVTNYACGNTIDEVKKEMGEMLDSACNNHENVELILFSDIDGLEKVENSGSKFYFAELTNPQIDKKHYKDEAS